LPKMKLTYLLTLAASLAAAQPTVYLIRHGEKPDDDDQVGLSTKGLKRAQCLRTVFGAGSGYNIGYIMAQAYKPGTSTRIAQVPTRPLGMRRESTAMLTRNAQLSRWFTRTSL
jgi:hypothetical protein